MHDRQPAVLGEQFVLFTVDTPISLVKGNFAFQVIGHRQFLAVSPECRVVTLCLAVMQYQEIPDVLELNPGQAIVFIDIGLLESIGREIGHQARNSGLNQVDAGGLQRLEKTGGQAQCHHVLVPDLSPCPGFEAYLQRIGQAIALDVVEQQVAVAFVNWKDFIQIFV